MPGRSSRAAMPAWHQLGWQLCVGRSVLSVLRQVCPGARHVMRSDERTCVAPDRSRSAATRAFARNFSRLTDLPIGLWDERLSTAAVERELIANDVSRAKRAKVIDEHAAIFILQGALDRLAVLKR